MAVEEVRVVVEKDNGQLKLITGPIGGGTAVMQSPWPVVGIWVFYEDPNTPGNQLAVEHSGHEVFSCFNTNDGETVIQDIDQSGAQKGVRRRVYKSGDHPFSTVEPPSDSLVDAMATPGGASWHEAADAQSRLPEARALAGFPPA